MVNLNKPLCKNFLLYSSVCMLSKINHIEDPDLILKKFILKVTNLFMILDHHRILSTKINIINYFKST